MKTAEPWLDKPLDHWLRLLREATDELQSGFDGAYPVPCVTTRLRLRVAVRQIRRATNGIQRWGNEYEKQSEEGTPVAGENSR